MHIVISSGHSKHVAGATGILNEVAEARRVVDRVVDILPQLDVDVTAFHDDTSNDQSENLQRIVAFHNSHHRDLDVSVHFNAYQPTPNAMGTECLYVTQDELAARVSAAISEAGELPDRGAKYRSDLYFLNETDGPAILIEVCFVDSTADAAAYVANFEPICEAIAAAIAAP
jgi:N-acetylmuramoyl-L-alanine amidase